MYRLVITEKRSVAVSIAAALGVTGRKNGYTPAVEEQPAWVQTGENADGFRVNRYFIAYLEMILGRQSAERTQYSSQDFTVEPIQGLLLADQLHDAVKYIHGEYREAAPPELDENVGGAGDHLCHRGRRDLLWRIMKSCGILRRKFFAHLLKLNKGRQLR